VQPAALGNPEPLFRSLGGQFGKARAGFRLPVLPQFSRFDETARSELTENLYFNSFICIP
jgi:hypothetical protein